MARSGDTFTWDSIGTWANPLSGSSFDIAGWNVLRNQLLTEINNTLRRDGGGTLSGQLKAFDGSEAAPGIVFSTELGSGLYRISAGVWGLSIGGALTYTFKDGAVVGDNNTSVVTSAALTTALAAIGVITPRYASFGANARPYTGTGGTEVLTSAKIGVAWTAGATSGVTGNSTDGTLTAAATGVYEIWYAFSVQFPSTATAKTFSLTLYKAGTTVTSTNHSISELASHGNRHDIVGKEYISITSGQALDLRALGSTGEVFQIINGNWGMRLIT